jgi:hypothetical protein
MESYLPVQSLFAGPDLPGTRRFLSGLADLPPDIREELPVLGDIAALCAASPAAGAESDAAVLQGPVFRGLNRRYLRIRFVQSELERLDFKKAGPGVMFNDFVFDQIDFSVYKKISAEDYSLYSREGLEDFDAPFFTRIFRLSRESVQALICGAYIRTGGFYRIKQEKLLSNPLLMSVLRTLQTSLEFAPLFTQDAVRKECRALLCFLQRAGEKGKGFYQEDGPERFFTFLLRALHGASAVHPDGMKTDLSAFQEEKALVLRGTFHPQGKAYTMTLGTVHK